MSRSGFVNQQIAKHGKAIHWNGPSCPKHGPYLDACEKCWDEWEAAMRVTFPKLHDEGAGL